MTRAEALEVLGLKEGASKDEVRAAYKNLIRKVHPDAPGGSGYLASKLNQAKQVLLG
jgi:curved DNA-binding protein CbpA